jgi:hypothetical protein
VKQRERLTLNELADAADALLSKGFGEVLTADEVAAVTQALEYAIDKSDKQNRRKYDRKEPTRRPSRAAVRNQREREGGPDMMLYQIFLNPTDLLPGYAVREFEASSRGLIAGPIFAQGLDSLEAARAWVPQSADVLWPRDVSDDPVIVETWM